jgi:hypothetical protein
VKVDEDPPQIRGGKRHAVLRKPFKLVRHVLHCNTWSAKIARPITAQFAYRAAMRESEPKRRTEMTIRLGADLVGELAALASEYDVTIDQLVNVVAKQALRDGSAVRRAQIICQLRAADELANEAQ